MSATEYAVQAMSRSTGSSGRWVNLTPIYLRRSMAEELAADRRRRNGTRAVYRVVERTVTPWTVSERSAVEL